MKNLTPELVAKAKTARSADELFELAKANGVELSEEESKTYFAQLGASGAVGDDELEAVAGGIGCGGETDDDSDTTDVGLDLNISNGANNSKYV